MNEVVTISGPSPRMKRGTTRLVIATALALVLATLGAAGVSAAPTSNPNAGEVELSCTNGQQLIWVNFLASNLSGGEAPAIVVASDAGRVYKVISVSGPEGTYFTHFHGAPMLERVVCTDPWGYDLTGVFIP